MNTVIIRRTFKQKADSIEQQRVTLCDLSILIERLKEQLHEAEGKTRGLLLSELRHARLAHKRAMERAS